MNGGNKKRAGALFMLGDNAPESCSAFLSILPPTDPLLSRITEAIFDLCSEDGELMTDMSSLEERLNLTRSPILKRCSWLVNKGLMEKGALNLNDGSRARSVYTFVRPVGNLSLLPCEEDVKQSDLIDDNLMIPFDQTMRDSIQWKGEWLSIFALIGGLRIGRRGKGTEGTLEVPIKIGRDHLMLTMKSTAGMKFMSVLDLRILLVIITLVVDAVENGQAVSNPFQIKTGDIVSALGKEKAGGDKRYVESALSRIEGTMLEITGIAEGLKGSQFEGVFEVNRRFRLIHNMTIVSTTEGNQKTPELLEITLDSNLWDRIMDKDKRFLLLVHPDSLKESRPLAIKFHLWCRREIENRPEMRKKSWSLKDLKEDLSPLQRNNQFVTWFKEFYEQQFVQEKGHAIYSGYSFLLTQWDTLNVWPDPDASIHHQALKGVEAILPERHETPHLRLVK